MIWKILLVISLILNVYAVLAINWILRVIRYNDVLIDSLCDFAKTFVESSSSDSRGNSEKSVDIKKKEKI